jgi:hypothetical protein
VIELCQSDGRKIARQSFALPLAADPYVLKTIIFSSLIASIVAGIPPTP